ncbi:MAG: biotin transporter BioY [Propionibacteriaceae bacterium]|jgi:biotin transport system substrate-specific component|nr:biotin transporter BioY [Propionibacteriaceae bacterium]
MSGSDSSSLPDRMTNENSPITGSARSTRRDTALIAVFAALIAVCTALVPGVPVGPVPITLQTLMIALTGLVLGPVRGCLAVLLYIVVGLAGLPIFAGGVAGLGVFGGGTVGYLLSFPFVALVTGWLAERSRRGARRWLIAKFSLAALVPNLLLLHPLGILGLMANLAMTLPVAALYDIRFVPGDVVKCVIAGAITVIVDRTFPALVAQRSVPVAVGTASEVR